MATMCSIDRMPMLGALLFAPVPEKQLQAALAIEVASYPADEAADEAKLQQRIRDAPAFFRGAYDSSGMLRGFICGTLTSSTTLTDESMSLHEPCGSRLCIHSVVVEETMRRQGTATWMLNSYMRHVHETQPSVTRVLLICKEPLVPLYEHVGFGNLGDSGVVHGQDPWLLMAVSRGSDSKSDALWQPGLLPECESLELD